MVFNNLNLDICYMLFRIRLVSVFRKISFTNSVDSPNLPFISFTTFTFFTFTFTLFAFSLTPFSPFHFHFFTFTFTLFAFSLSYYSPFHFHFFTFVKCDLETLSYFGAFIPSSAVIIRTYDTSLRSSLDALFPASGRSNSYVPT